MSKAERSPEARLLHVGAGVLGLYVLALIAVPPAAALGEKLAAIAA